MSTQDTNDKIDLIKVTKTLWNYKIPFIITCTIGIVLGIIVAFSIPKTYQSEVTLAPEITSSNGLSGNLGDIASMVGVDLGGGNGASVDAIYPEIYPQVISSTPFITDLFNIKVSTKDNSLSNITLYEYISSHQQITWWAKAAVWVRKTFGKKPDTTTSKGQTINPRELTKAQEGVMSIIKEGLSCKVDKKTSIISISVITQDPLVSASLADTIQTRLQKYITDYRTKKARADLDYTVDTYRNAKTAYEKARLKYGDFGDANEDITQQSLITKRDELENDMQLKYNIMTQSFQQVQMAKDKLREQTPAFTQIQPPTVANEKYGPKRLTIILVCGLFAFILTAIIVLFRDAQKHGKEAQDKYNIEY